MARKLKKIAIHGESMEHKVQVMIDSDSGEFSADLLDATYRAGTLVELKKTLTKAAKDSEDIEWLDWIEIGIGASDSWGSHELITSDDDDDSEDLDSDDHDDHDCAGLSLKIHAVRTSQQLESARRPGDYEMVRNLTVNDQGVITDAEDIPHKNDVHDRKPRRVPFTVATWRTLIDRQRRIRAMRKALGVTLLTDSSEPEFHSDDWRRV